MSNDPGTTTRPDGPPSLDAAAGRPADARRAELPPTTLGERAVARLSSWLDRLPAHDRRSFLVRTAVVGSALAMNPWSYAVRDAEAYDAVCGSGNTCADGWSAFCCTVNDGKNTCPPGTFTAGWWKADNSSFCCGAARYYIDCNVMCGTYRPCRCVSGTCDNRYDSCNQFRYGQCNQQIACYGPVACRVVSCTPPWILDATCTTASATDNNTVTHSAPCLPGACPSPIEQLYFDLGGPGSGLGLQVAPEGATPDGIGLVAYYQHGAIYQAWGAGVHEVQGGIWATYSRLGSIFSGLGYPTTNETTCPDGVGRFNHFGNGSIYWTPATGAFFVWGAIRQRWAALGWERSVLGYPTTDELPVGDGVGRYNAFQSGRIYWSPTTDAHEVHGLIGARYAQLGGPSGGLGYPTTDELVVADGIGRCNHFSQNASIYWSPVTGAWDVRTNIRSRWASLGWERSPLGYPVGPPAPVGDDKGSIWQPFQTGRIYFSWQTDAHAVYGGIFVKYAQTGGPTGVLGMPLTDETGCADGVGRFNHFANDGSIYWTPATGAHWLAGPIRDKWNSLGAERSSLGYPTVDPVTSGTVTTVGFEHGSISYDSATTIVSVSPA